MARMLPGSTSTTARQSAMQQPVAGGLLPVGYWLYEAGYRFITVTPATHTRVLGRACRRTAESLTDIFGWNLPFHPRSLPRNIMRLLENYRVVEKAEGGLVRSLVRFSTLGDSLYLHSGFPTVSADAVFFGPDTYRFVALIERTLPTLSIARIPRIADIGCGTGAGGIAAAKLLHDNSPQLLLTDINPRALEYAAVNIMLAGEPNARLLHGDLFEPIAGPLDLVVANPPYLLDTDERIYRHGGGELGSGLSLRIVREGLSRLAPGGTLILYTASPIVEGGRDIFRDALRVMLNDPQALRWEYSEIDPDVFGEELENPAYRRVERIAAVSLVVHKTGAEGERTEARPGLPEPA